jgi:hypothetical protein
MNVPGANTFRIRRKHEPRRMAGWGRAGRQRGDVDHQLGSEIDVGLKLHAKPLKRSAGRNFVIGSEGEARGVAGVEAQVAPGDGAANLPGMVTGVGKVNAALLGNWTERSVNDPLHRLPRIATDEVVCKRDALNQHRVRAASRQREHRLDACRKELALLKQYLPR